MTEEYAKKMANAHPQVDPLTRPQRLFAGILLLLLVDVIWVVSYFIRSINRKDPAKDLWLAFRRRRFRGTEFIKISFKTTITYMNIVC